MSLFPAPNLQDCKSRLWQVALSTAYREMTPPVTASSTSLQCSPTITHLYKARLQRKPLALFRISHEVSAAESAGDRHAQSLIPPEASGSPLGRLQLELSVMEHCEDSTMPRMTKTMSQRTTQEPSKIWSKVQRGPASRKRAPSPLRGVPG